MIRFGFSKYESMRKQIIISLFIVLSMFHCSAPSNNQEQVIQMITKSTFVGTYTRKEGHVDGKAAGILRLFLDEDNSIVNKKIASKIINPSFLKVDEENQFLYAVSETGPDDGPEGILYSFRISENGLQPIDSIGTSGWAPCHVSVNKEGNLIMVANYVGGAVTVYRTLEGKMAKAQILKFEGKGTHPRQESSHTHMTILSPDEQFLLVADLGSNVVWNFRINEVTQEFETNPLQPKFELGEASGPRHMAFHPDGKILAIINELSNTIVTASFDSESGVLSHVDEVSTLNDSISNESNNTADIHFHPNGKFLYGSNRGLTDQGHNSIAVFSVSEAGYLQQIQLEDTRGLIPRNFALSSNGEELWVANQNSDNLVRFSINPETGRLGFLSVIDNIMTPVCIEGL
jgi:6-phosphogluconolactonase